MKSPVILWSLAKRQLSQSYWSSLDYSLDNAALGKLTGTHPLFVSVKRKLFAPKTIKPRGRVSRLDKQTLQKLNWLRPLAKIAKELRIGSVYAGWLRRKYRPDLKRKHFRPTKNPDKFIENSEYWGSWDWSLRDIDLSRKYVISRERVRQIRSILGKPKVGSHPTSRCSPPDTGR